MKLAFMPMLIVSVAQYFWMGDEHSNFWVTTFLASQIATWLIPIIYYPIRCVLKREILFVSIAIYFISMFLAFLFEYYLFSNGTYLLPEWTGMLGFTLMLIVFGIFTFSPPRNELFRCPVSGKFGD
jgi:hypothetical protein